MKSISVLGSGWLGLPLAAQFVRKGYRVSASTRSASRLEEIASVGASAQVVDIDAMEFAAPFFDSEVLVVNITSKNFGGFERLVDVIAASAVRRVIFVSSTSVYRNSGGLVAEEQGDEDEQSPLLAIENLFRRCRGFDTTVLRFAGLIGYSRHPGRFFGDRALADPDSPVNLIHRDDCIAIIERIIERNCWGEVFNACADTHPPKREFYRLARQSLGLPGPRIEESVNPGFKVVNNEKLKRVLEYRFKFSDLMTLEFAPPAFDPIKK